MSEVSDPVQTDSSAIAAAESLPQSSVRQRAVRVLELLGVSQSGRAAKSAPSAAQSSVVPDLLGGIGGEAPTESGPTEQSRQTDGLDMLGTSPHKSLTLRKSIPQSWTPSLSVLFTA